MSRRPRPLFLTDENMALATDLYELTMAAGYFEAGRNERSSFELFVRDLPPNRGYLVVAGLEQVVHFLRNIRFGNEAIAYLRGLPVFRNVGDAFFDYLRSFRFSGDLEAMPEGTVAFPGEPLLTVTAPLIEAQVVETYLLSTVNYQTLVATKAARVVEAARGRSVVDFGSRRAHGPQAGLLAARASYIGGCVGTSNVLAGQQLGIPVFGTQAHSWVMSFPTEREAFETYRRVFPDHAIFLLDTYETLAAARTVAALGPGTSGVRLDSGDLVALSRQVRRILDQAGLRSVKILASGDLNEYVIADILRRGARIDSFGVGTELVTSRDAPALGGVYKLVEQHLPEGPVPRMKQSTDKHTYPGRKQVFRQFDSRGRCRRDIIALADESLEGEPLVVPVMRGGQLIADLPPLEAARARAADGLAKLPPRYRRLENPPRYPVRWSRSLEALRKQALLQLAESRGGQ